MIVHSEMLTPISVDRFYEIIERNPATAVVWNGNVKPGVVGDADFLNDMFTMADRSGVFPGYYDRPNEISFERLDTGGSWAMIKKDEALKCKIFYFLNEEHAVLVRVKSHGDVLSTLRNIYNWRVTFFHYI